MGGGLFSSTVADERGSIKKNCRLNGALNDCVRLTAVGGHGRLQWVCDVVLRLPRRCNHCWSALISFPSIAPANAPSTSPHTTVFLSSLLASVNGGGHMCTSKLSPMCHASGGLLPIPGSQLLGGGQRCCPPDRAESLSLIPPPAPPRAWAVIFQTAIPPLQIKLKSIHRYRMLTSCHSVLQGFSL